LIIIFPTQLITLWIGDREIASHAGGMLRVLAMSATLSAHTLMPYILLVSAGRSGTAFRIYLVTAIALFATTYILALHFGAMGGAVANLVCYFAAFVGVATTSVPSIIPTEVRRWLVKGIALPHIAAAVPVLFIWMIMPDTDRRYILLVVFTIAGVIATAACAMTASWFRGWLVHQFAFRARDLGIDR